MARKTSERNVQKLYQKKNSDRGNRTPGCRVRDDDVSHYTISDMDGNGSLILDLGLRGTNIQAVCVDL